MRRRLGSSLLLLAVVLTGSLAGQSKQPTTKEQLAFGNQMAQRGLWSEALFRFQRAEMLDPRNPSVLNNMAVAYEALGLFEEALAYYRKAIEVDSGNADLKRNYARFAEFYEVFRGEDDAAKEGDTTHATDADQPDPATSDSDGDADDASGRV